MIFICEKKLVIVKDCGTGCTQQGSALGSFVTNTNDDQSNNKKDSWQDDQSKGEPFYDIVAIGFVVGSVDSSIGNDQGDVSTECVVSVSLESEALQDEPHDSKYSKQTDRNDGGGQSWSTTTIRNHDGHVDKGSHSCPCGIEQQTVLHQDALAPYVHFCLVQYLLILQEGVQIYQCKSDGCVNADLSKNNDHQRCDGHFSGPSEKPGWDKNDIDNEGNVKSTGQDVGRWNVGSTYRSTCVDDPDELPSEDSSPNGESCSDRCQL